MKDSPDRSFAFIVIDFLALAVGPKHCDIEVIEYKTKKSLGRMAFDIHIK